MPTALMRNAAEYNAHGEPTFRQSFDRMSIVYPLYVLRATGFPAAVKSRVHLPAIDREKFLLHGMSRGFEAPRISLQADNSLSGRTMLALFHQERDRVAPTLRGRPLLSHSGSGGRFSRILRKVSAKASNSRTWLSMRRRSSPTYAFEFCPVRRSTLLAGDGSSDGARSSVSIAPPARQFMCAPVGQSRSPRRSAIPLTCATTPFSEIAHDGQVSEPSERHGDTDQARNRGRLAPSFD